MPFAGHGGKRCSRYAAQHLPENFHAAVSELTGHEDEHGPAGRDRDLYTRAMRLAYRITHEVCFTPGYVNNPHVNNPKDPTVGNSVGT